MLDRPLIKSSTAHDGAEATVRLRRPRTLRSSSRGASNYAHHIARRFCRLTISKNMDKSQLWLDWEFSTKWALKVVDVLLF